MKRGDRRCEYLEIEFKAERRANAKAQSILAMAEKHQGGQCDRGRENQTED